MTHDVLTPTGCSQTSREI